MTGAAARRVTRLNAFAGWGVFAVVALAPVPLGSNRPFFWALWACVIGAIGLSHALGLRFARAQPRVPLRAIGGIAAAFFFVGMVMLIQILPIGDIAPIGFRNQFGYVFASRTLSSAPGETALALLRWGTCGGVFFLLLQAGVQERRNRLLMRGLLAVAALQAGYALVALNQLGDTILFFAKSHYAGSATGTFVNRNALATFLGLGLVLACAAITRRPDGAGGRGGWRLTLLVACVLLLLSALVATQSRMGLFASLAGAAMVLVLRRSAGPLVAVGIAAAGVVAVIALYGSGVAGRLVGVEQSAAQRFELYRQTLGMILERPFLGYGAGSFAVAFPAFHEPSLRVGVTWDHAHSTYLALWSGLGLAAGSVPLLIVAAILALLLRNPDNRSRTSVERAAAIGATVTVALHALVDFSLEIEAVALFYVTILALGSARPLSAAAARRGP